VPDAGTFWYHPHVRSNIQVEKGLYGAIVVRDPAEPDLDVAVERVLVLDDVLVDPANGLVDDWLDVRGMMMGREGNILLVNGQPSNGALTVVPGQRVRLRVVNAATARYFKLRLDVGSLIQIGSDGGLLSAARQLDTVLLVPGERLDLVIEAPGAATLRSLPYERATGAGAGEEIDLVRFNPADMPSETPAPLPASLRPIDVLPVPAPRQTLRLGERMVHHAWQFTINDQVFPNVPPVDATAGTRQIWRVENGSEMDHPFHLHGFFFQRQGVPEWKDTLNIPALAKVNIVIDFAARNGGTGDWMYHCHILEHADRGMMGEVRIR
jgi:FtsP/CotA-like multicopper oxidase with cupredoxin domain